MCAYFCTVISCMCLYRMIEYRKCLSTVEAYSRSVDDSRTIYLSKRLIGDILRHFSTNADDCTVVARHWKTTLQYSASTLRCTIVAVISSRDRIDNVRFPAMILANSVAIFAHVAVFFCWLL